MAGKRAKLKLFDSLFTEVIGALYTHRYREENIIQSISIGRKGIG